MRQKIRRIVVYVSLLLFPVTLNYFSPYVSIDGAFNGIVAGSVLVFLLMFFTGIFFRRAWCAWVCPVAGLSEMCATINNRTVNRKRLRIIRYSIFAVWFAILVSGFVLSGGIRTINPLHLTEQMVSVDEPLKFITYYLVVLILFVLTSWLGRRGACHAICWMSPFLVAGDWLGRALHVSQLQVKSEPSRCIDCKRCNQKCPMSIDVNLVIRQGSIKTSDCIQCGECVAACPQDVLCLETNRRNRKKQ
ncbi:MAG: 4Fe-4S dicluster domain-containing protein [Clostridia bacterium]|nr:4Fe-4S dicluster domain-containing protein [Clostridia bacterium]